jgi:hypothetical protein
VIPDRDASPLPLLDHVGVGFLDQLPTHANRRAVTGTPGANNESRATKVE